MKTTYLSPQPQQRSRRRGVPQIDTERGCGATRVLIVVGRLLESGCDSFRDVDDACARWLAAHGQRADGGWRSHKFNIEKN